MAYTSDWLVLESSYDYYDLVGFYKDMTLGQALSQIPGNGESYEIYDMKVFLNKQPQGKERKFDFEIMTENGDDINLNNVEFVNDFIAHNVEVTSNVNGVGRVRVLDEVETIMSKLTKMELEALKKHIAEGNE